MKIKTKLISGLIFFMMCILCISGISTIAQTDGEWTYEMFEYNGTTGVAVTGYSGNDADVYIPAEIEVESGESKVVYPVLKLGEDIFRNNTNINSVILSKNVKVIGANAFSNATNMVCIVTNDVLTQIEDNAFSGCTSFNSIILNDTVTQISDNAFSGCDLLTVYCNENSAAHRYVINNSIKYVLLSVSTDPITYTEDGITYYILNGTAIIISCDAAKTGSVIIPATIAGYPVTEIRAEVFKDNPNITSVTMSDSIKKIGVKAFENCALTEIELSAELSYIGECAFKGANALKIIEIPKGIKSIDNNAFAQCSDLTSAILHEGLESISDEAFLECTALQAIDIPGSVKSIGSRAFERCSAMKSAVLNEGLESISDEAFLECTALQTIDIPGSVKSIGNRTFEQCSDLTAATLHDGIESIGYSAFFSCVSLTSLEIPDSVTSIDIGALQSCSGLTHVKIPSSITTIPDYMFCECSSLTSIAIPDGITSLGKYVFDGCLALDSVILPESISSINDDAFDSSVIIGVYEDSYIHKYAVENRLPYVVVTSPEQEIKVFRDNGFKYYISGDSAILMLCYERPIGAVIIPDTIEGYPVTEIGANAFGLSSYISDITSVTLPDSIIRIGDYAFYSCVSMESINMPASLTEIGENAFSGTAINTIIMPDTVTDIGRAAFSGCQKLSSVQLSENIDKIPDYLFNACWQLEELTIPNGVTSIGNGAFSTCGNLSFIDIPNSVTNIGNDAFSDCRDLSSVTIPNSISSIIDGTFSGCTSLTDIDIPDSVTNIGKSAFSGCTSLTAIDIPDNVSSIGESAFSGCISLTTIDIPGSVSSIENNTFKDCSKLTTVSIPEGVLKIGSGAFANCELLNALKLPKSINNLDITAFDITLILCVYENTYAHTYADENELGYIIVSEGDLLPEIFVENGIKYYISDNTAILHSCDRTINGSVVIPDKIKEYPVTAISQKAFYGCNRITKITLPDSITKIGKQAFESSFFTEIALPSALSEIGAYAFYGSDLKTLVLPEKLTKIGEYAFSNSDIESIVIPKSVTNLGNGIFRSCDKLVNVQLEDGITEIPDYSFEYCKKLVSIKIPDGVTSIGKSAFSYCTSLTSVEIPESVITIEEMAFDDCTGLTSIEIPNGITSIERRSFFNCDSLTSIKIPNGVTNIGESAFESCNNLNSIEIPNSATIIGESAFSYCARLTSIKIPDSVTSIGSHAFTGCNGITTIVVPEGVTHLGWGTFSACTNLISATLPEGVTELDATFSGCENLTSVNIPSTVTDIWNEAFADCSSLTSIIIPEGVTTINGAAFANCTNITSINIPSTVTHIGNEVFAGCTGLTSITIPEGVTTFDISAFSNCTGLDRIILPKSISCILNTVSDNSSNLIMCVYDGSFAHNYFEENDLLHFVIRRTDNPYASNGQSVEGTVTSVNGSAKADVTVELIDKYGNIRETVVTDENGEYSFTYAEVGSYIIRATDAQGNTGSDGFSIRRKNVFEVYLIGNTDITIQDSVSVSGTVTDENGNIISGASISLIDETGMIFNSVSTDENGQYYFSDVPNGTYTIHGTTSNGGASIEEIAVFAPNGDTEHDFVIRQGASVNGTVVNEKGEAVVWAEIIVMNSEGDKVSTTYTDKDGNYAINSLPMGSYSITAVLEDVDTKLKGAISIQIDTIETVQAETIVVKEEKNNVGTAVISGKVTAHGQQQISSVVLKDVFMNEIAVYNTSANGKYKFINIADGAYVIVATTDSDGASFTSITVKDGSIVSGSTNITVYKTGTVEDLETQIDLLPATDSDIQIIAEAKDKIIKAKNAYDSLSDKNKKRVSSDKIDKLNCLTELISSSNISVNSEGLEDYGFEAKGLETVISDEEINNEKESDIILDISVDENVSLMSADDEQEFDIQQINNKAEQENKTIVEYFDIGFTKAIDSGEKTIKNVKKDSVGTGKIKITLTIPEEHRGHKNYSMLHMHNGQLMTLADIDNNSDTVTFETDKFSKFALAYDDNEKTVSSDIEPGIVYDDTNKTATIVSDKEIINTNVIFAAYSEGRLVSIKVINKDLSEGNNTCIAEDFDTFSADCVSVMVWQNLENMLPLFDSYSVDI